MTTPGGILALLAFSLGGLGALYGWAGDGAAAATRADVLGLALLRADVDRQPDDVGARCRLARAELALGLHRDADRTLAPLLLAGSEAPEVRLLALDTALGAWRAAAPGKAQRAAAERNLLARLESILGVGPTREHLAQAALVARELGRPELAARAYQRAAVVEADPHAAIDLGLQALDAYRAADDGSQALRLARDLMQRFPGRLALLLRAEEIALAQNAVSDAAKIAERVAAATPDDPAAHLAAARVLTWAGQPEGALRHWMWLARRSAVPDAGARALELARGLRDESDVAELLTRRGRRAPLSRTALVELALALSGTMGSGAAVAALRAHAAAHRNSPVAWEALAAELERGCDLPRAVAVRLEARLRFGQSVKSSIEVARLQWAAGRPADAMEELRPWLDSTPASRVDYWSLVADVAWHEEADALALRAYDALWESGHIDATGAERLLLLARGAGRTDELIQLGRGAWGRLREPRLLLLAMDEAARAERWEDVEAMAEESSASVAAFASVPAYWMLRARLDEHAGRIRDAFADYRRALEIDPKSKAARSGVRWLLASAGERTSPTQSLLAWGFEPFDEGAVPAAHAAPVREPPSPTPRGVLRLVGVDVSTESIAGVVLVQQRAFGRTGVAGGELEARAGIVEYVSNGPRLPGTETRPSARFVLGSLGGLTEVTAGASIRSDRNVLQAAVARTQMLPSLGEARFEASLNEPADESLALRMHAVRTRAGGAVAVAEGHAYQRVAIDAKRWTTRAGSRVGAGAVANVEIGWRTPDLVLRLQGSYQRNSLVEGRLPGALAGYSADAMIPGELALIGAGAGAPALPLGPLRLSADALIGAVAPHLRPAFRVEAGVAATPFANGDLRIAGFAANDRFASVGDVGLTVSLAHRFGI